jgi:DNA-directed RNA polymerase specialized sigma24 family protein
MAPEANDTLASTWAQLAAEARRLAIGRRLAPGHTPEDVAQDAMLRLLSDPDAGSKVAAASGGLIRCVVSRLITDGWRRWFRRGAHEQLGEDMSTLARAREGADDGSETELVARVFEFLKTCLGERDAALFMAARARVTLRPAAMDAASMDAGQRRIRRFLSDPQAMQRLVAWLNRIGVEVRRPRHSPRSDRERRGQNGSTQTASCWWIP